MEKIQLTQTVKKGGCAAKVPAGYLTEVLGGLEFGSHPELLVNAATLDDACLWDLGDERCMVQTLDFFTPIVDDPYDFGAIAAANALSDIYAMGGLPKIALSILAFPMATLNQGVCRALMEGANDKIKEAGAIIAGGHSIDDETLKLGFAVTGFVDKHRAWTNAGAREGDVLLLTKPLGVGTIVSAIKRRETSEEIAQGAITSMKTLNDISYCLAELDVRAATDITGFGLAGHALQMANASKVTMAISLSSVPVLPGALDLLRKGVRNMAHLSNRDYAASRDVAYAADLDEALQWLSYDPQTSGGLLLAVPANAAERTVARLQERFPATAVIGQVQARSGKQPVLFSK